MAGSNIIAATVINPQVLVSQQLGASDSVVYTAPVGSSAKISQATICNVSNGVINIYLSVLKAGQTLDSTHRIIHNYPISGGDSLPLNDYLSTVMLGPGDMIAAFASTAGSVNLVISGTVHS